MLRFAAAVPFTNFCGRPEVLRRVVLFFCVADELGVTLRRAVRFFFLRFARRGPIRAWVAAVCCANPANPPGGTNGFVGIVNPRSW